MIRSIPSAAFSKSINPSVSPPARNCATVCKSSATSGSGVGKVATEDAFGITAADTVPASGASPASIPGIGGIIPDPILSGTPFTPANSPGRGGILSTDSPASLSTGTPTEFVRSTKTSPFEPLSSPFALTASHALHPNSPNCKPAKAHKTANAAD